MGDFKPDQHFRAVVIISSDIEWEQLLRLFPDAAPEQSPYGAMFVKSMQLERGAKDVLFFQGGWGKIAAAASAQYVLSRWSPELLVNLGTCGGFRGEAETHEILLVESTIVYDIMEAMTDQDEAVEHYGTRLDLSWLNGDLPMPVRRTKLVSADRDLRPADIPWLRESFEASAADWESGAIAWTAKRNRTRCLILRGVSDLVGEEGGDAYDGNVDVFAENAGRILQRLVTALPAWLEKGLT